jgi:hypothetical protein
VVVLDGGGTEVSRQECSCSQGFLPSRGDYFELKEGDYLVERVVHHLDAGKVSVHVRPPADDDETC